MIRLTEKQQNIGIIIGVIILLTFSILIITKNNNVKIIQTPYVCWSYIPNWQFSLISRVPLSYKNTQVSYQQNFIFVNKNESTIYWYQFIFAVNNYNKTNNSTYIGLEKWKAVNGTIVENKFIEYKKVNMNIIHLQPIYYNISNNSVTVFFASYNKTENQIYNISENISEGFKLANPLQNYSILNKIGFYSSNHADYEVDFNNTALYGILSQALFCEKI